MSQHAASSRRGPITVVLLVLLPLTALVATFGPLAIAVGSRGVHEYLYPESHLTYSDGQGEPVNALHPRFPAALREQRVTQLRQGAFNRTAPLLMWSAGLVGVIALWSAVLPMAMGRRGGVSLGLWRSLALLFGAAAAVWLLALVTQSRASDDKSYISWMLGYGALAGLAAGAWVVVHRVRPESPR